jgi:hypothetical protein
MILSTSNNNMRVAKAATKASLQKALTTCFDLDDFNYFSYFFNIYAKNVDNRM